MYAILVRAKIATEMKTLLTREQWPDSVISQLAILHSHLCSMFLFVQLCVIQGCLKLRDSCLQEGDGKMI